MYLYCNIPYSYNDIFSIQHSIFENAKVHLLIIPSYAGFIAKVCVNSASY